MEELPSRKGHGDGKYPERNWSDIREGRNVQVTGAKSQEERLYSEIFTGITNTLI
jgi:hypothetical protein